MQLFSMQDLDKYEEIMTVTDLVEILKISRPTVVKLFKKQGMPHFRAGSNYLVTKRGFLEYINNQKASNEFGKKELL
jgi:excisionase family DNA binding protein